MAGTPKNSVGAKLEKLSGDFLMIETFQQAHPAATREPAMQSIAEPVYVEERQREQQPICA